MQDKEFENRLTRVETLMELILKRLEDLHEDFQQMRSLMGDFKVLSQRIHHIENRVSALEDRVSDVEETRESRLYDLVKLVIGFVLGILATFISKFLIGG